MNRLFKYEIVFHIRRVDGTQAHVSRLEHAYSLSDAVSQASFNSGHRMEDGDKIVFEYVGPPRTDIKLTEESLDKISSFFGNLKI